MAITWSSWMRYLLGGLWNPETGIQRAGPGSYSAEAGQLVTDARALQVAAVFRCIRIIAETAASLPLVAYQRVGDGEREPLPMTHWLPRLIEEPNPTQTGDEWREAMYAQMAGWGNGYSRIARQSEGRPVELWVHKADAMEVERQRDRSLVYRYPNPDGQLQELNASQVLHLRAFSIDGVMGMSPLALARESLGLTVGAERYAASFFAQGGRPAGVMTSEKLLSDKQREQIRREYGDMSATDAAATGKRFWLLEGSLKYQPITVSPEDMQMLQTRAFQIADIARFFGVPLFLLMETEKSTSWGSGIEQQNLGFLTYTLRPYLSRMVNSINRWIIPEAERARLFVDVDDSPLVAMDSAAQEKLLSAFADHGIMTRNEIRARLKMRRSTDANADKLTAQSAMLPIDRLGQEARPVAPDPTERAAPHVVVLGEAFEPITDAITAIAHKQIELSGAIEKLASNAGRLKRTIEVPVRDSSGRIQMVTRQEEYTDGA
jgi:HK97 family phage portal protein